MRDLVDAVFTIAFVSGAVRIATPVLLAALGELVTERAGVMNLSIEGMMLTGAFTAFITTYEIDSLWLGVVAGMLSGALVAVLMAVMSVTMRLDQVVSGLAINVLASGLTFYLFRVKFQDVGQENLPNVATFGPAEINGLSSIPVVGEVLFSQPPLTYVALLAVPLTALFLARTRYGLEIRVIGENPRAADMRGVSVSARRYAAVVFGGMMAGIAGAFLTLDSAGLFVPNISGGRGFIAFALVIVGNWSAGKILLGSLFFGAIDSLQLQLQAVGADLPYQLLLALPYLLTIVVLVVGRRRSGAPLALGRPYARETS
jgi:general nucleoside transport system permease protein